MDMLHSCRRHAGRHSKIDVVHKNHPPGCAYMASRGKSIFGFFSDDGANGRYSTLRASQPTLLKAMNLGKTLFVLYTNYIKNAILFNREFILLRQ